MKHGTNHFWKIILVLLVVPVHLLRARRAQDEGLSKSGLLIPRDMFRDLVRGVRAFIPLRNLDFTDVLIRHIGQKVYCAC